MRVAALDLGTNTFLLLVADVESGQIREVLHDEVRVVRLGQGVHENRRFHPEALERAEACFADYSKTIESFNVEKTLACATSAARDVANGAELVALAEKYRIPVEIISGEREAELTFSGTINDGKKGSVGIIDVGGGSTEFIFGEGDRLETRFSVDVGSVRLTELFVKSHPIPKPEIEAMRDYIKERIREARSKVEARVGIGVQMIAVAGTPTTLATVEQGLPFESSRVHGFHLSLACLREWVTRLAAMSVAERQKLAGMEPKRADVIVAGALILQLAAEAFSAETLEVSIRGLRFGIAKSLNP